MLQHRVTKQILVCKISADLAEKHDLIKDMTEEEFITHHTRSHPVRHRAAGIG